MANILTVQDLHTYSIALQNSGIAVKNLQALEMQVLVLIFGRDGAKTLVKKINAEPEDEYINRLLEGDNELFPGLKALLATIICANLISQNRLQVGRQNIAKQLPGTRPTNRREETDVVQSLSFSARSILYAMSDFLEQDGNNPLKLVVYPAISPTPHSVNSSGTIPAASMGFWPF